MKLGRIGLILCVALLIDARSQVVAGVRALDTSNLHVEVSVDKDTYLPGEVAQLTLSITNTQNSAVLSPMPFLASTGCVASLMYKDSTYQPLDNLACQNNIDLSSNTVTLSPGESKTITLRSYESLAGTDVPVLFPPAVASMPGKYAIVYRYGTSSSRFAEYRVATAKLEADAVVKVRDVMFSDRPGISEPQPISEYIHVFAVRSEQMTYVCVSLSPVTRTELLVPKDQLNGRVTFDGAHVRMPMATPFMRIATSVPSIASISANADPQGNLRIEWVDADGRHGEAFFLGSLFPKIR